MRSRHPFPQIAAILEHSAGSIVKFAPAGLQQHARDAMIAVILLLASSLSASAPVAADDSAREGLVEISAALDPADPVVPGQRVRIIINVATPRWFTAGTRLRLPEVPGLVLLQNQDFAANATERRGAESWSVQRWTIDAFATRAGSITIPPLDVSVSVSQTPSREYKDTLQTRPLTLTAVIPPELEGIEHWIASPKVTLEQTVDSEPEVPLGGAIKRSVVVKADNVMAMQLPELGVAADAARAREPALEPVEDDLDQQSRRSPETSLQRAPERLQHQPLHDYLQRYPEPPVLRNRANRGSLSAERRDTVTWIAIAPGEVTLPAVEVKWWNTETGKLQTLSTEPVTLTLSGELPEKPVDDTTWLLRALVIVGGVLALAVSWRLYRLGLFHWLGRGLWRVGEKISALWHALRDPVLPGQLNPGGTKGSNQPR